MNSIDFAGDTQTPVQTFLPLAQITLTGEFGNPKVAPTALEAALAQLMLAASAGQGAIPMAQLAEQVKSTGTHPIDAAALRAQMSEQSTFFVVEDDSVTLPRYATQRTLVRQFFEQRWQEAGFPLDSQAMHQALNSVLPPEAVPSTDGSHIVFDNAQQRLAVAALADARVGVMTGGPGTGKTTTAAALLAVLKRLDPELQAEQVLVAAPTGKAACRIAEALAKAAHLLFDEKRITSEERAFLLQIKTQTLHKALVWSPVPPEKGGPFRCNAKNPLRQKLVLVDEASMIDLGLMHALVKAMPAHARLLLLGDRDQLESVEVGGVLAELVARGSSAQLSDTSARQLGQRLGLEPPQVQAVFRRGLLERHSANAMPGLVIGLADSRRAMEAPWILQLAQIVRPHSGLGLSDWEAFFASAAEMDHARWHQIHELQAVCNRYWEKWRELWSDLTYKSSPDQIDLALRHLGDFQVLCSSNAQVDRANVEGMRLLWGHSAPTVDALPHACPIMVLVNQPGLGLANGDVGVALAEKAGLPARVAVFAQPNGGNRALPLTQLPKYRPALALTIHKGQGSEWRHVAIELPQAAESELLDLNLLYTAVTRASQQIDVFGTGDAVRAVLMPRES